MSKDVATSVLPVGTIIIEKVRSIHSLEKRKKETAIYGETVLRECSGQVFAPFVPREETSKLRKKPPAVPRQSFQKFLSI